MTKKQVLCVNCNIYLKKCFYCWENFITENPYKKFCSDECKNKHSLEFDNIIKNITGWNY